MSSNIQKKKCIHFLVSLQTESAAVGQMHDINGEALVSGLIAEAELHLRAARCQPLLIGAQKEVCRETRPKGHTNIQTHTAQVKISGVLRIAYFRFLYLVRTAAALTIYTLCHVVCDLWRHLQYILQVHIVACTMCRKGTYYSIVIVGLELKWRQI